MKISYNIDDFLHGFWKARESTYLHRKSIFCGETFWNYIQSFRLPHRNFKLKCRSCPGSKCLQIMQKSCHFSAFFNPVAKKWRNRSFQHLCILPLFTHVQKKLVLQKIYGNSLLSGIWSQNSWKVAFFICIKLCLDIFSDIIFLQNLSRYYHKSVTMWLIM